MSHTVYVLPLFIPILLAGKLILVKVWQRLHGDIFTAKLEADFWAVVDWPRVALVLSTPNSLSHLLTSDPTSPLADAVLLKHRYAVLIRDLNGLYPYLSRATCSLIATNIGDLVIDNRAARLESWTLWRQKEVDTLLGAAYRPSSTSTDVLT